MYVGSDFRVFSTLFGQQAPKGVGTSIALTSGRALYRYPRRIDEENREGGPASWNAKPDDGFIYKN